MMCLAQKSLLYVHQVFKSHYLMTVLLNTGKIWSQTIQQTTHKLTHVLSLIYFYEIDIAMAQFVEG